MRNWKPVPVLRVEEHPGQFQVETGYGGITVMKKILPTDVAPKVGDILLLLVDNPDKPLYPGDKVYDIRLQQDA